MSDEKPKDDAVAAQAAAAADSPGDAPKSSSLKGLGKVVGGAATEAVVGKSKALTAAKKGISTAKDLAGPAESKDNGVDQVVGDVTKIAVSAVKGAATGAAAGAGVGAIPGAIKSGVLAAAKTKSGRKAGIVLIAVLLLPSLMMFGLIGGVLIGMSPMASSGSQYRNAAFTAALDSGLEQNDVSTIHSAATAAGVRWEWIAGIYLTQKDSGEGEGPLGIDIGAAEKYVKKAHEADSASRLTVISKDDANDLMKASAWAADIFKHMESHDQELIALVDQSPDAASVPVNSGESAVLRAEPTEEQAKSMADAEAHKKAWVEALKNLPMKAPEKDPDKVYNHARIVALGSKTSTGGGGASDVCSIIPIGDGKWTDPVVATITSGFGPRVDPTGTGLAGGHLGTDLSNGKNEPYYSASSGTVTMAAKAGEGDGGNGIIVDAGGGINIWYWHAVDNSTTVKVGDVVKPGQVLGTMGTTGMSTGIHLHFEVHVNGTPVDAIPFMEQRGIDLGVTPVGEAGKPDSGTGADSGLDMTPQTAAPMANPLDEVLPKDVKEKGTLTFPDPSTGAEITLTEAQKKNASGIIGSAEKVAGAGKEGAVIAIMVAMQESTLRNLSNPSGAPESVDLPNDGEGGDNDSVGLFQQRPSTGWGTVKELMTVDYTTRAFFGGPEGPNPGDPPGLLDVSGWESMDKGVAAQKTQRSAVPDGYSKWEEAAEKIVGAVDGTYTPGSSGCTGATDKGDSAAVDHTGFDDGEISADRAKILAAAAAEVGTPYVWGGTSPETGWDCSGYVQWAYKQAGKDISRTNQWGDGVATATPKPGDLMAQAPSGPNMWSHVAIYAGKKDGVPYAYHALNPQQGTILVPVDSVFDGVASYFNLMGDK